MGKRTREQRRAGTRDQRVNRPPVNDAVDLQPPIGTVVAPTAPPWEPTHIELERFDVPTPKGTMVLWSLGLQTGGHAGRYWFTHAQFGQMLEQLSTQHRVATGGASALVVANEQQMHAVAEQAKQLASGLVVPDGR